MSVAGNAGHIQASPGVTVTVTDRLTAAASPLAAFAGLMIGFLVLKKVRQRGTSSAASPAAGSRGHLITALPVLTSVAVAGPGAAKADSAAPEGEEPHVDQALLADAVRVMREAAAAGHPVSQRALAAQLRERGHRFSNAQLSDIVNARESGDATPALGGSRCRPRRGDNPDRRPVPGGRPPFDHRSRCPQW